MKRKSSCKRMKVKVDGMNEKPVSPTDHPLATAVDDILTTGVTEEVDTGLTDHCCGGCKQEGATVGDNELQDGPLQYDEDALSDADTLDFPDSTTRPDPPPRCDSHRISHSPSQHSHDESHESPRPRVRHMVDMLGGFEHEETFAWDSHREYLLSCMGFVNGLACLLKTATYTVKHGGGVFFTAYVICMLVFGCPLIYLETTLGQYSDGGPVKAWRVLPLFQGLGYAMVSLSFLISTYYMMEITWAVYYFGVTISSVFGGSILPWHCGNSTEPECAVVHKGRQFVSSDDQYSNSSSFPSINQHSLQLQGAIQYFYANILELSDGLSPVGSPVWYMGLCLFFVWVCVYACLLYGPSSLGKMMYVLAPYPYITLPVLFGFSCFYDGSLNGVRYFLSPDWDKLAAAQIWCDAGKLLFLTLSLGTGCLHTLAGYTHFHSHCYRNLILICICNVIGVALGGLTMCSGIGILAHHTNTSLENLTTPTEYELGYALYPYILSLVSDSTALLLVYFSTIFVLGLSTVSVHVQNILAALLQMLLNYGKPCSRYKRWMVQLILCSLFLLIGLMFTTKIGLYTVFYLDMYVRQISGYLLVLCECLLLMYVYGARRYSHNIEDMTGHKNSPWWTCNWKFLTSLILLALIAGTVLYPMKLQYQDILYPDWSRVLGWCLSLVPVLWIPGVAIIKVSMATGSFSQRIKQMLTTPANWGPGLISHEHSDSAPDYVICHPDNHRPAHGLAMLTANLYVPQLIPLTTEDVPVETASEMTGGYMSDLLTITSADSIDSGEENEERGNWRGKLEFVLSCLGYVIGLGNIWRFPYLVYRNGGGAFFIPYLVMLLFCGVPLVYMEMAFGQYASLGPVTIWRALPLFKGVGYSMVLAIAIVSIYYNTVNAWAFHYLFSSFTATLPWSTCDNDWNTEACSLNKYDVSNCTLVNATYLLLPKVSNTTCAEHLTQCIQGNNDTLLPQANISACIHWLEGVYGEEIYLPEWKTILSRLKDPSEEYFYNAVLNQTSGLHELGGIQWQLALYLLLAWVIVFLCLVRGIYSAGKVAYFVVIIPIVLLLILLICAMLVEGHLEGIRFYVTPKWGQLLSLRVWSDAASQVFFSLSACTGGLTTLSSYNKFHNNIYRDALLICAIDTLMSVLAGFTVFASIGILANQLDTTVENVVTSSTGLVFVAIPAAVSNFQPSAMWSAFFFLMIVMMGMSSILVMTEVIVTVVMDENVEMFRKSRILVLFVICCLLYLLGLPLTTRGGSFLLELLDEYCGGIPNIVVGLLMCLGLAWLYKVRHFCTDIRLMVGRPVSWWWRSMWCIVSPLVMLFILVSIIVSGVNLDAGQYPSWAEPVGILLAIITVFPIPLYAVKKILSLEGSFQQRVRESCLAQENWGPALIKHWKHVEYYPAVNTHTMAMDLEQSPVHAISDRVDFSTSDARLPKLSEASLMRHNHQMSPKKPQELRHKAILNHAYSNPQCHISNGSIDQMKSQLSLHEPPGPSSADVLMVTRKKPAVKCHDASIQTDARSYTNALKNGSVRSLKEMKIETEPEQTGKMTNGRLLQVEVTKF